MEIIEKNNLDYIMNVYKACGCDCVVCRSKDVHSTINCEIDCKKRENVIFNSSYEKENLHKGCDC